MKQTKEQEKKQDDLPEFDMAYIISIALSALLGLSFLIMYLVVS